MHTLEKKISTLYAVPWFDCNLTCPHCNVRKTTSEFNIDKFKEVLSTVDAEHVVLFGGEPTLVWAHFISILETGKVNSISTNMVVYPYTFVHSSLIPVLKEHNLSIATSWNKTRFNDVQFTQWLMNLKELTSANIDVTVLITLTQDLLAGPLSDVLNVLGKMERAGVKKFLYEPCIGSGECNKKADKWLCKFHDEYKGGMTNLLEEKLDSWFCNCDDVYTLLPTGELRKGCPDSFEVEKQFCSDCLNCDKVDKCRPCILQKTCSYPKKLAEKLGK